MHFYINVLSLNLIVVLNTIMGYIKEKSMYFREKYHLFCTAYKYGVFKRELQHLMSLDENVIRKCLFPLLLKL